MLLLPFANLRSFSFSVVAMARPMGSFKTPGCWTLLRPVGKREERQEIIHRLEPDIL